MADKPEPKEPITVTIIDFTKPEFATTEENIRRLEDLAWEFNKQHDANGLKISRLNMSLETMREAERLARVNQDIQKNRLLIFDTIYAIRILRGDHDLFLATSRITGVSGHTPSGNMLVQAALIERHRKWSKKIQDIRQRYLDVRHSLDTLDGNVRDGLIAGDKKDAYRSNYQGSLLMLRYEAAKEFIRCGAWDHRLHALQGKPYYDPCGNPMFEKEYAEVVNERIIAKAVGL